MLSSLFILNRSGDVILEKHWSTVQPRTVVDAFWGELVAHGGIDVAPPVLESLKHVFIYVPRDQLVFLAVVMKETPPLFALEMVFRFLDVLTSGYVQGGGLTEDKVRDNFVTIYSLLDEFADNGYPLTTDPSALKDLVPPPSGMFGTARTNSLITANVPDSTLGVVSWRKSGIRYSSNEIFFDLIEEVDAIVDVNGMMLSQEVQGRIECRCRLSGMPDVQLNFLDPTILDDVSFHPCVRYARYEADRSLSFLPPDGAFTLMTYRINRPANIPLYVKPQISFNPAGGRITIMSGMRQVSTAAITVVEDVVVSVPLPTGIDKVECSVQGGSYKYDATNRVLKWDIGKMSGAKTCSLNGNIKLSGSTVPDGAITVNASWKIPQTSISGLKIESVNITNEKYKAFKGVRAFTQSGKFQIRT